MITKEYIEEKIRKARKDLEQMEAILSRCPYELDHRNINSLKEYLSFVDNNLNIVRNKFNETPNRPRPNL